ncbi:hypothetical protein [Pseudoxanthomonas sp. UTMC 1351]|uniref:hypothetical protein n=1 Tax=Pseudoxanthomonas sp. UTMC 1351 TaxID=2695853 RepID=UPI0034CDA519
MFHINVHGQNPMFFVTGSIPAVPAPPAGTTPAGQHFVGASNVPYSLRAAPAAWASAGTSTGGEIRPRQSLVQVGPYAGEAPLDLRTSGSIKTAAQAVVEDAMSRATTEGKVPPWFDTLSSPQRAGLQWHWSADRRMTLPQFCEALGVEYMTVLHYVTVGVELPRMGQDLLTQSDRCDALSRDPGTGLTKTETVAVGWAMMSATDRARYRNFTTFCRSNGVKQPSVSRYVMACGELTSQGKEVWARLNKHMIDTGYARPDGGLTAAGVDVHSTLQAGNR